MRCLQCGVEMALVKKLRNSTEFCSEDCGRKYQDESNQLAVSRLMQQRKPKTARAAVSMGRYGETTSVGTTAIAVSEPPLGEFLPQKVWAILEAHPQSSKVDWQLRKGSQVMPTLSLEAMSSMLALAFANMNETHGARGPRVGVIDDYLPAEPFQLWTLKAEEQPLQAYLPAVGQGWSARWPEHWNGLLSIAADSAEPAAAEHAPPEAIPTAAPAATATVLAPKPAEPVAVVPAQIAPLKVIKPDVIHAINESAPTSEAIAMPQLEIQIPESTMLPLRPRIVIAPRTPSAYKVEKPLEPEAKLTPKTTKAAEPAKTAGKPPEKVLAEVKPTLATKPAESRLADSNIAEAKIQANLAEAKIQANVAEAKIQTNPAEAQIPEVKLEARRPEKPATEVSKSKVEPSTKKEPIQWEGKKASQREAPIAKVTASKPKEQEAPIAVPTFGARPATSAATGLWHRMPWWERGAAVIVFLLSIGGWLINGRPAEVKKSSRSISLPSPAPSAPNLGADSWSAESATDLAGVARGRQLSIYRPSRTMKDYVIDFQGTIQERSLGWIVRATDTKNYYCLKLEMDRGGSVKLVRFGVIDGREDAHTQVPLSLPPTTPAGFFRIRAEAKGPNITTYVNGKAVDVWVDQRLTRGAAGFSNERGERAVIKTVQVSF